MRRNLHIRIVAAACLLKMAATAQRPSPNAAIIYRKAFAEMAKVLRTHTDDPISYPSVRNPNTAAYRQAPWPLLLQQTAVARSLFMQAASTALCKFDKPNFDQPNGKLPLKDEVQARVSNFVTMRALLVGHAWSVLETQPGAALADVEALFACARHLEIQNGLWGSILATNLADEALLLCDSLPTTSSDGSSKEPLLRRALQAVQKRDQSRATPQQLADYLLADARATLAMMKQPKGENATAIAAVQGRALELVDKVLMPLRYAKAGDLQKVREGNQTAVIALKQKFDKRKSTAIIKSGSGEALAALMASMVVPNSTSLFQAWENQGSRLVEVEARLRQRLGAPKKTIKK